MILCVERVHDFSHTLNYSGCIIYFCGGYMIFMGEVARIFFVERFCDFFVERLHDFF